MTPQTEARLIEAINERKAEKAAAHLQAALRENEKRDIRYRFYKAQIHALKGRSDLVVRELRKLRRTEKSPLGTCFAIRVLVSFKIKKIFARRLLSEFEREVANYTRRGGDKILLKYLKLRLNEYREELI